MERIPEIQRYIATKQLDDKYAPFFADDNAIAAYLKAREDLQYDEATRKLIAAIKRIGQGNDGLIIQV